MAGGGDTRGGDKEQGSGDLLSLLLSPLLALPTSVLGRGSGVNLR